MSVALVCGDGDGVRKVDAARVFAGHGDSEKRFPVAVVEVLWQPRRLVAEHKNVVRLESAIVEGFFAVCREEEQPLGLCRSKIIIPRVVKRHVEMRPVVKPRPGYRTVVKREAERFDEMKRYAKPDA